MAIFGLSPKTDKSSKDNKKTTNSNADEAKAMLQKMEAKKASGACPFC